jgi:hypothetical protein
MKKGRYIKKSKKVKRFRHSKRRTKKNKHKFSRLKGGLRRSDCVNIGVTNAYRFNDTDHAILLRRYMFGTKSQEDAWMELLRLCSDKKIPVYILTSGNKVGIIRMLQLALLDKYITEVLCTHPEFPVNPLNHGTAPTHNFHGQDKYEVIQAIVSELGLPTELELGSSPIGYFLDDDEGNFEHKDMCSRIIPKHVLLDGNFPPDFNDGKDLKENDIYKLNVNDLKLTAIDDLEADFNFTPISIIKEIIEAVQSETVRILFLDFDKTLQIHNAAIQFHIVKVVDIFSIISKNSLNKRFGINEFAPLPQ